MRPAGAQGEIHPRVHPGWAQLEPGRILEAPAAVGLSLLDGLDQLGARVASRYAAHRAALPAKRRISASSAVVLTGVVALAGLFGWGVIDTAAGANQWMNAPGAGNAEAAMATSAPPTQQATALPQAGASTAPAVAVAHRAGPALTVHESLVLLDGGMTGHPGAPEYVGGKLIDLPANAKVVLTIYSFDDGTAPLAKSLQMYDKVTGTAGGTESYDGTTVSSVPNKDVAHTFTVPGIGLNLPVPAAQSTKAGAITPAVVTASFVTSKKGSFTWQCYAPCGSGKAGMGGAMQSPGEMTGKVVIG